MPAPDVFYHRPVRARRVSQLNIAVLCEYSGTVRDAFTRAGHYAVSVDLLASESPGTHFQMDVFEWLEAQTDIWDLIIAHPPCTALCVSGNGTYAESEARDRAILWTRVLWETCRDTSPRVCFENPVGVLSSMWRKPDQYIQPWQYGHGECKRTGLWLHNLKTLEPTRFDPGRETLIHSMAPSPDRGKKRSLFYPGVADAMADQWTGDFVLTIQTQP